MEFHVGDQVQARGHTWTIRRIMLNNPSDPRLIVKRPGWRYLEVLHPREEKVTLALPVAPSQDFSIDAEDELLGPDDYAEDCPTDYP